MLHMDLCGPVSTPSLGGRRYILVIIDEFTRYTWVFFLRYKSDTTEEIIKFIKKSEVLNGQLVRSVRSDNGTELKKVCWMTFSKKKASLRTSLPENLGKFDPKADEGIFVGYSLTSKSFRVYNLRRKCIDESIHVKFDDLKISSLSCDDEELNRWISSCDDPQPTQPQHTLQIIPVSPSDIHSSPIQVDLPSISPQNCPSNSPLQISYPPPLPTTLKWTKDHPIDQIIGDQQAGVQTRRGVGSICLYVNFLSLFEPKKVDEALADPCWITAMQEELS
ncbi:hypothetical protein L6452_34989 [Arctium lappa]|uniref:Uncharacterized protein n=1 Tax=Arctium lappa TaxID=4217 RepID=A0ACB8YJT2_ARCLA|nr:hypothetical protein L6452_34989 [Arctium lappa]